MNHDDAIAVALANLKGRREKDLIATAEALSFLKSLPQYSSNASVGAAVGVSGEMVREFLSLLRLPVEVQEHIRHKGLTLEHGRRLAQVAHRQPELLSKVLEAMDDLNSLEARHLVEYVLRNPSVPVSQAKQRVENARQVTIREYHVVAVLPEEEYRVLVAHAKTRQLSTSDLVTGIVLRSIHQELRHG